MAAKYDWLVAGSGLFGAVFAERARAAGKKIIVIEKRPHIGGNIYTENIEGIAVHRYGAHIFHTNSREVWNYVNRFAEFNSYTHQVIARFHGEMYSLPFSMYTFNRLWGVAAPEEARQKIEEQRGKFKTEHPRSLEEAALSLAGRDIYEKLIKGYTEKQWGRPCAELPPSIIRRLPFRFSWDNNYFDAAYQGIPARGYTALAEKLLAGTEVRVETDFLQDRAFHRGLAENILFTGPIDAFFDYAAGALEYRSLRFETEIIDRENYQGAAVINYTDRETPFTRIIEHRHFDRAANGGGQKTVITREYPLEWKSGEEPYYPVENERNTRLFAEYRRRAESEKNIFFGGRLGSYRYLDMDQVIAEALAFAGKML